jgi:hypothetical protein
LATMQVKIMDLGREWAFPRELARIAVGGLAGCQLFGNVTWLTVRSDKCPLLISMF